MAKKIEKTDFDKTADYEEKIKPLVKELKKQCVIYDIPCFLSFVVKNDDDGTEYETEGNLTGSNGIHLTDDKFRLYLLAMRGATLLPPGTMNKEMESRLAGMEFYEDVDEEYDEDQFIGEIYEKGMQQ